MLDRAAADNVPLSPMKLLKLVYIAYGWTLAVLDDHLFDEPVYAWAHGPVIRSVYDEFKHYGSREIDCRSVDFDLDSNGVKLIEPRIPETDIDVTVVLGKVWEIYKRFSAWDLRNKTHEAGTPWAQVYNPNKRNIVIPPESISQHFKTRIRQYLNDAKRGNASAPA